MAQRCDGIALVEFDIDRGCVVRAVVPGPLPVSPVEMGVQGGWGPYLADQMVPDGSEKFDVSTTWLVLNRPRRPFVAVCLQAFLLTSHQQWVGEPQAAAATVHAGIVGVHTPDRRTVFESTAADVSVVPLPSVPPQAGGAGAAAVLSRRNEPAVVGLLFDSEASLAEFCEAVAASAAPQSLQEALAPVLYGLNVAVTRKDAEVRRGSINKAIAVFGRDPSAVAEVAPLIEPVVEACCDIRGSAVDSLEQQRLLLCALHEAINAPRPSAVVPLFGRSALCVDLLDCIGAKALMRVLFGAALGLRVVIFAKATPAEAVVHAALAVGLVLQRIEPDALARRVFPYSSITSTERFASVPGYVVGTLNPIFETQRPQRWWDLLADLESREVRVAEDQCAFAEASADWDSTLEAVAARVTALVHVHRECDVHTSLEESLQSLIASHLRQIVAAGAESRHSALVLRSPAFVALCRAPNPDLQSWALGLCGIPIMPQHELVKFLQRGLRLAADPHVMGELVRYVHCPDALEGLAVLLAHPVQVVAALAATLLQRCRDIPSLAPHAGVSRSLLPDF